MRLHAWAGCLRPVSPCVSAEIQTKALVVGSHAAMHVGARSRDACMGLASPFGLLFGKKELGGVSREMHPPRLSPCMVMVPWGRTEWTTDDHPMAHADSSVSFPAFRNGSEASPLGHGTGCNRSAVFLLSFF